MEFAGAIRRYFRGESSEQKIARFEEYESKINALRNALRDMSFDLSVVTGNMDTSETVSKAIIANADVTKEDVKIAVDNIRFANGRAVPYISELTKAMKGKALELKKIEADMSSLIKANPDMAGIIIDVAHDNKIKKALETVVLGYKNKVVDRGKVLEAYNKAKGMLRTDMKLSVVIDEILGD